MFYPLSPAVPPRYRLVAMPSKKPAAPKRSQLERDLYPKVQRWMEKQQGCFVSGINTGISHGRIDVVGLRDIGGNLSGKAEVVSVEVKAGRQPFATAAGQAYGYTAYADRAYLADYRTASPPFRTGEVAIASRLGIGLLAIRARGPIQE